MGVCEMCGNEYDKTFTVTREDFVATFDSIECAAAVIAPACDRCGCRILGHGVETEDGMYCCGHCARDVGPTTLLGREQYPAI